MLAAVLVPLTVLLVACLMERLEARVTSRAAGRTRSEGTPKPTAPAADRHLRVVRADDAPAEPSMPRALPRAS